MPENRIAMMPGERAEGRHDTQHRDSSLDPRTRNNRILRKWRVWKDDSEVKSSGYSSTGSTFGFQHIQGSLQLCVTPVPEDTTPSSGFHEHQLCKQYKDTHSGKAPRCTKRKEKTTETGMQFQLVDCLPSMQEVLGPIPSST